MLKTGVDTPLDDAPTTAADWAKVQSLFPRSDGRRMLAWVSGVSPRLGRSRLSRLLAIPASKSLAALLDQRSVERVKALRTYAAINLEQASAALRMTIIVNVSIPVIVIAILSQISSGQIWTNLWSIYNEESYQWLALAIPMSVTVTILIIVMAVGATRLGQARDIRHLIDLFAADRGIYFGLDDMDDLQAD